jgi:hypothetical protein
MFCSSLSCPATPETVVMGEAGRAQLHLSLQDRRGPTFLEIKAREVSTAENSSIEARTIRIGPTFWSAFLAAVQRLHLIIANL